jgi:hypothetical protein
MQMPQGVDASHGSEVFPVNESSVSRQREWGEHLNSGKPGADGTGVEILASRTVALPKTANRQRATMQTPQGLDATHGGELFPVSAITGQLPRNSG